MAVTVSPGAWKEIYFDTTHFEYASAKNQRVRLKASESNGNVGVDLTAFAPGAKPGDTPKTAYQITDRGTNCAIGKESDWVVLPDCNAAGTLRRVWALGSAKSKSDTFHRIFRFKVPSGCATASAQIIFIGFYASAQNNQRSFIGAVYTPGSNQLYAWTYTSGSAAQYGAAATVANTNDATRYMKVDLNGSVLTVGVFSDAACTIQIGSSSTFNMAAYSYDNVDEGGYGSYPVTNSYFAAISEAYPVYCTETTFYKFNTALPVIYTMQDAGADDATWDMSQLSIPNHGGGTLKAKYLASNTYYDVTNSGDQAAIAAGLNGSWLEEAGLQAEDDQSGRYLYLVIQYTSDGTQRPEYGKYTIVNGANFESGGTPPGAPGACSISSATPGDGQVALALVAASETDVLYGRYRLRNGDWSDESEPFTRTGSGNLTITGLTNDKSYEFIAYAKSGSLTSPWSAPVFRTPTNGTTSMLRQVCNAVAEQINSMALTDSDGVAIAAAVEIPPIFENVATACVKVFPGPAPTEPTHCQLNAATYHVHIGLCQQAKTDPAIERLFDNRQSIQELFTGSRLADLPTIYCQGESSRDSYNYQALMERFDWMSILTLEFVTLRQRA